jgi:chromosome segregation ATPase
LPKSVLPYIPPARSADNFAPSQPTIPAQLAQKLHDASSRREFPRIENFSPKLLENTGMDTSSLSLHVQQLLDSQTKELNQLRHTNQLLRDQNQTFQSRVRELEMDVSTSALQLEENRRQETQDRAEINHLTARLEISEEDLAILQQDYRRVALANPRKSSEESFDEQILASLRKEHQEQEINLLASQAALDRSQELLRQSLDTQAWLIAELKGLLVEKKDCMDQLTTLKRNPDMRLLFLRTSLRASQTALTKAQDEALSLRQTITYQCETISDLRGQLRVFYL